MKHFTSRILMISPDKFRNNELTLSDNSFQSRVIKNTSFQIELFQNLKSLKNLSRKEV